MKGKFLLIFLITSICLMAEKSTNARDFSRRYGANSHITNIPLYFKHPERKPVKRVKQVRPVKKQKVSANKTRTQKNHKTAMKKAKISKKTTRLAKNQKRTKNVMIANRKETKENINGMRRRQKELELEKIKLEREMVELQKKKFEFGLAKV